LIEEFGVVVPLHRASELFGLSSEVAAERAAAGGLPVPAFRLGSNRSPWFVHAADLAALVVARRKESGRAWREAQREP
jgi:hypothetical protein